MGEEAKGRNKNLKVKTGHQLHGQGRGAL
jgi:hypothetical protein